MKYFQLVFIIFDYLHKYCSLLARHFRISYKLIQKCRKTWLIIFASWYSFFLQVKHRIYHEGVFTHFSNICRIVFFLVKKYIYTHTFFKSKSLKVCFPIMKCLWRRNPLEYRLYFLRRVHPFWAKYQSGSL